MSASTQATPRLAVATFLAHPEVAALGRLRAGAESASELFLDHPRIQKSGLVLVGHVVGLVPTRVQLLGETELSFLHAMNAEERGRRCRELMGHGLSLVIVTRGAEPPPELLAAAEASATPLFVAEPRSSQTIATLHTVLDRILAPQETRHGVLIDVHGIGTLLLGPSGIGKSECALFLVERGHRLVADDQVRLLRTPDGTILGSAPPLLRHHLELRGIGIVHIRDLFGATAVRDTKAVELVCELCPWDEDEAYERLGLDDLTHPVLGVDLPFLRIPVQPGRNMAVILEVAARNQLLKGAGRHAARDFVASLEQRLLTGDDVPEGRD